MAESKELTTRTATQPARAMEEQYRLPPVDIYETEESIILLADMPGVSDKGVEVTAEKDTLYITGRVQAAQPKDATALYQEFEPLPFRRIFVLSGEIRREGIEGKMHNGVLRLVLPKSDQAKVRKIPIRTE